MPADAQDHTQLISTFTDFYLEHGLFKSRRDVVNHFFKIEFNFDFLVHSLLNSMLTSVLPLDIAIHVSMMFLMEG